MFNIGAEVSRYATDADIAAVMPCGATNKSHTIKVAAEERLKLIKEIIMPAVLSKTPGLALQTDMWKNGYTNDYFLGLFVF